MLTIPTLHVQPRYPVWDGALLITLVGTSIEPALLVAGVKWSLSIRGRTGMDDHALSSQAPGTLLRALMDDTCDVYHEGCYQRVDSLFSIARGKAMFGYLPRV